MDRKRSVAAKKAARTRAKNRAADKHWTEVEAPIRYTAVQLANLGLDNIGGVLVRFNPRDSGLTLNKGDGTGTLLKILGTGLSWRVWPTGYAKSRDYWAGFWEVIS